MIDQAHDQIISGQFLGLASVGLNPPADRPEGTPGAAVAELVVELGIINKAFGQ